MTIDPTASPPIRVVVVDDSAVMRQMLTRMLDDAHDITVVDAVADPFQARQSIKATNPDVVTLDIEMPKMDGLTFLEKIMTLRPMPVVMVSSLTQTGAEATMRALELGAVDFVGKPNGDVRAGMMELTEILRDKVRAAAVARVKPLDRQRPPGGGVTVSPPVEVGHDYRVIGMAASTGGVEALGEIIAALPPSLPGVMVVQHMPGGFTRSFAARLDTLSALTVREAGNGMRIERGHVYIAPGNHHLRLARDGNDDVCRLSDDKPVSGHRPSADVLFNSIAEIAGARSLGVILTGMGKDGAHGLLNMRLQGAVTLGQDESSSLIYGMPRVAHEIGAVTAQVPLKHMAATIPSWLAHERRAPIQV